MDLRAIGLNYNLINGSTAVERLRSNAASRKVESAKEQTRPKDTKTSVVNQEKGRIVDVSF